MDETVARERIRRRSAPSGTRLFRNYTSVMVDLCKENSTPERVGFFTKVYSLLVMSGLLFPRSAGGVAWELTWMTVDVDALWEYNWSAVVWSFLVEAIEDTKQKIPSTKNLQMAGFAMLLQIWFYEHTTVHASADEKCVPRIASWVNLFHPRNYDASVVISSITDKEIVPCIEERDLERADATV